MTKRKILLIDANKITRKLTESILQSAGYETYSISHPGKLNLISYNEKFNLVLTDIFSSLKDTFSLLKSFSAKKIIIYTNYCNKNIIYEALSYGASGYIIKSFISSEEFLSLIQTHAVE